MAFLTERYWNLIKTLIDKHTDGLSPVWREFSALGNVSTTPSCLISTLESSANMDSIRQAKVNPALETNKQIQQAISKHRCFHFQHEETCYLVKNKPIQTF